MPLTFRELHPSEYCKIPPEATQGRQLPNEGVKVVVALDGDQIVGMWCAMAVVHLEPLWIASTHRNSPSVLRRMWNVLRASLVAEGVASTLTVIDEEHSPVTAHLAQWLGGTPLPGRLWFINVAARVADKVGA